MRARVVILLLAVLLPAVLPAAGAAQEATPSVSVGIAGGPFTVGDPIRVRMEVRYPQGAAMEPPALDPVLGPFEVREPPQVSRSPAGDGQELLVYEFTVAAYQPGPLTLPSLPFTYRPAAGAPRTLASPATVVEIQSVLPADGAAALRDLKPQAELGPEPGPSLWWVPVGAAAAAAAIAAGVAAVRRTRARPAPVQAPPPAPLSPEEAAVAELDRIAALNLIEQRQFQTFYLLLGDCIRRYLTDRHGFRAVALTTSELRGSMEAEGVSRWQARLVEGLLTECDAVVYAGYMPAAARAEGDLALAYEIVEMTRPRMEAVQGAV